MEQTKEGHLFVRSFVRSFIRSPGPGSCRDADDGGGDVDGGGSSGEEGRVPGRQVRVDLAGQGHLGGFAHKRERG